MFSLLQLMAVIMSKPREFWIRDNGEWIMQAVNEEYLDEFKAEITPNPDYHVIEYSAYEQAIKDAQLQIGRRVLSEMRIEQLRSQLADIKALLDHPFDSDITRLMQIRNRL